MASPKRDRRVLPHNLDAEASVLGGILLRNEVLAVLSDLEPDDFYDMRHKVVFQAIRALEATARAVDVVTLEAEIEKTGKLEAIGGVAFLGELALRVPTADNVEAYAKIVIDHRVSRDVMLRLSEVIEDGYAGEKDGAALIEDATMALMTVRTGSEARILAVGDLARAEGEKLIRDIEARESGKLIYTGVPTGIAGIDDRIGGHPIGVMTIYAARPAQGKAQPHDEPVLTPTGWRRIGDLAPGDLVTGADGAPTPITHVFERGPLPIYRVRVADGGAAVCAGDHLWTTRSRLESDAEPFIGVNMHTTDAIAGTLVRVDGTANHVLPVLGEPCRFAREIVAVEPLGVAPCRCISVAALDGLYVTRDRLVTHNSTATMMVAAAAKRIADMDTLIISVEDSETSFGQRALAQESGVSTEKIRARNISREHMDAIYRGMSSAKRGRREAFVHFPGREVEAIVRLVKRENMKRRMSGRPPLRQVIIDYLQKIVFPRWARTSEQAVRHISTMLSRLAETEPGGLAVVSMVQIGRDVEKREDHIPTMADLSDSSQLEKDGKLIFGVHHPWYYDQDAHAESLWQLYVLKNANGRSQFSINLFWDRETHSIYNSELEYGQARIARNYR